MIADKNNKGPSSQHRSLGGVADIIGNGALFATELLKYIYGPDEQRDDAKWSMVGAALVSTGGFVAAFYGEEAVPKQFSRLQRKLAEHLELSGAQLEDTVRREFQLHQPLGLKDKLNAFLHNYPAEIFSTITGLGAVGLLAGGIKKGESGNIAMGASLIAAALVANFMPEKTTRQLTEAGQNPHSLLGKMQHRPMMVANGIALTGNIGSAYAEGKKIYKGIGKLRQDSLSADERKTTQFELLTSALSAFSTANFIAADILMGTSSKKASGTWYERHQAQQEMIVAAASILATQTPEMQRSLAEAAVAYLTKQPELRMSNIDPKLLTEKVMEAVAKAPKPEMVAYYGR